MSFSMHCVVCLTVPGRRSTPMDKVAMKARLGHTYRDYGAARRCAPSSRSPPFASGDNSRSDFAHF